MLLWCAQAIIRLDKTQVNGGLDVLKFTKSLQSISVSGSLMDGQLPDTFEGQSQLQVIDFTHNQLCGELPLAIKNVRVHYIVSASSPPAL